jgi:hypothetical protein
MLRSTASQNCTRKASAPCVPGWRFAFLIAGLIAAAMRMGTSADFLFVTGLLFQFAIWFESWWTMLRSR